MSQATIEKFRKLRAQKESTPPNAKEKMLDALFSKYEQFSGTPSPDKVNNSSVKSKPKGVSGYRISSHFGGGSIIVQGKEVSLPVVISDPVEYRYLENFYSINKSGSPLISEKL